MELLALAIFALPTTFAIFAIWKGITEQQQKEDNK